MNATSGQLKIVRYYADGALIGTSTRAPFGVNWNTKKLKDGVHIRGRCRVYSRGVRKNGRLKLLIDRIGQLDPAYKQRPHLVATLLSRLARCEIDNGPVFLQFVGEAASLAAAGWLLVIEFPAG